MSNLWPFDNLDVMPYQRYEWNDEDREYYKNILDLEAMKNGLTAIAYIFGYDESGKPVVKFIDMSHYFVMKHTKAIE